jgi:GDP-L-fucose synthase
MRVLVTGGGGFLGSHLVERLQGDGHDVHVARRADHDLTRADDTARLFADAEPEVVYHLAAEVGGIGANRANPGRYWYANLLMGAHVLEQARLAGHTQARAGRHRVRVSEARADPFREDDLWNGYPEETTRPYGVAKKAVLVGAQAYREQYGLDAIFLLPANLYGPRDNFHETNAHVIADLIRKMAAGDDEVVLWGDGSPTREFLYVEDCVDGLVLAAERYDGPDPVNLAPARRSRSASSPSSSPKWSASAGRSLGHVDAERAAATQHRRDARAGAVRLRGAHAAARRAGAHGRVVSRARPRSRVTSQAAAAPARVDSALLRIRSWWRAAAEVRPAYVLVPLLAVQWLAVLALALTVRHNGWLYYAGGDQLWHYTGAYLLAHGHLPPAYVGYGWSMLLLPVAAIAGPNLVSALPALVLFNTVVLLPAALLCMYGIGARIAGRLFGYLAALLWIVVPYLGIVFVEVGYHQKYTELTLPQDLGLSSVPDFPATVALIVSAYLCLRALDSARWEIGALAGLAAGYSIAIKPSNAIFLVAPGLLLVVERWRSLLAFAAGLAPSC